MLTISGILPSKWRKGENLDHKRWEYYWQTAKKKAAKTAAFWNMLWIIVLECQIGSSINSSVLNTISGLQNPLAVDFAFIMDGAFRPQLLHNKYAGSPSASTKDRGGFCQGLCAPDHTVFVSKLSHDDTNQVYHPADTEQAECQQPENACTDSAGHKSVDAKTAQKPSDKNCAFFAHSSSPP